MSDLVQDVLHEVCRNDANIPLPIVFKDVSKRENVQKSRKTYKSIGIKSIKFPMALAIDDYDIDFKKIPNFNVKLKITDDNSMIYTVRKNIEKPIPSNGFITKWQIQLSILKALVEIFPRQLVTEESIQPRDWNSSLDDDSVRLVPPEKGYHNIILDKYTPMKKKTALAFYIETDEETPQNINFFSSFLGEVIYESLNFGFINPDYATTQKTPIYWVNGGTKAGVRIIWKYNDASLLTNTDLSMYFKYDTSENPKLIQSIHSLEVNYENLITNPVQYTEQEVNGTEAKRNPDNEKIIYTLFPDTNFAPTLTQTRWRMFLYQGTMTTRDYSDYVEYTPENVTYKELGQQHTILTDLVFKFRARVNRLSGTGTTVKDINLPPTEYAHLLLNFK